MDKEKDEIKQIPRYDLLKTNLEKEEVIIYNETEAPIITYLVISVAMALISVLGIIYVINLGLSGTEQSFYSSITILFIASATIISSLISLKQVIYCKTISCTITNLLISGFAFFTGLYLSPFSFM